MDETSIAQAHDPLFKLLREERGAAQALLRERLPKALLEEFTEDAPERVPATFIGEGLHETTRADRRFRQPLRDGEVAWIQCDGRGSGWPPGSRIRHGPTRNFPAGPWSNGSVY